MANEEVQQARTAVNDRLAIAIRQSLPAVSPARQPATFAGQAEQGSWLTRFFEDREDRRHRTTLKVTRNVAGEAVLAQGAIALITTNLVESALESNKCFEQTMYEYRDSELAMAAAPGVIQTANALLMSGLQ
ncbi:MAG TPA: hypothetical protein VG845_02330, partial [Dehalococcoidia bacterium]|nr:hypothetical protein [Dehalococcoidia bacterium]